ncbi:MAG TPA: MmcQ/YjbR family DNA-binding protein [Silvibacterium sp.]|nr:MmcQ/YjbR family DNA-binding protein [Silvibacterium sp.]
MVVHKSFVVEDPRLSRLTEIALALPETTRQVYGSHAQFLVRKKTFAYFLDNHHGDGIVGVTCKVMPGENNALVAAQPRRFYLPAYLASRGWVALRLDTGRINWNEVRDLLVGSYLLLAPKNLGRIVEKEVTNQLRGAIPAGSRRVTSR